MHLSSPDVRFAASSDHADCRMAIQEGSKTFYAASMVLPPKVRQPAYGLYAFCRMSDDAIDLNGGSLQALERLRERLARVYEGRPLPCAEDRAMADLVRDFGIPRSVPEALLEGLAWDAQGRRYETIEDLQDYAARVASTVGVMMSLIMGVRSTEALARACDLGTAMQLTNIARDVGEDARAGRVYLPLSWLREVGLDEQSFLANPQASDEVKSVVARLLQEADRLYKKARQGIAHLPPNCRPAIATAALLYAEIGRKLERSGLDSINQRARVSGKRKLALLAQATLSVPFLSKGLTSAPLQANAFLVQAVAALPVPVMAPATVPALADQGFVFTDPLHPQVLQRQVVSVLNMFERLERAEQFGKQRRLA